MDWDSMPPRPGHARGERVATAKLTAEQVRAIRASTETQTAIAARYGVRQTLISRIRRREIWRHVED